MKVLLISNDQTLDVLGLQDRNSGSYIVDAVVSADIIDKTTGLQVGSTVSLAYVIGTAATYRGNIPHTLVLVSGRLYGINITAVQGALQGYWQETAQAQYRF